MFILLLHYEPGALEKIDTMLDEHYAYVDRHMADGTFVLTGRRVPRTGGAILATGTDRARIERIVAEDPFQKSGAARYEIIQVDPTRSVLPAF
ncbi:YciI family protein [Actinomadura oligospora]|uniref:YciI family protein n=1 Tax=Actinomadura oligospora TaxID=111804 RepID=UPI00047C6971|nr:YciI family protein [Actinomadura oligospora]